MSDAARIDDYTNRLSHMLSTLPETDRKEIVEEIRAHLEHRAGEKRLDEALSALGAPQLCARGFLEELKLQEAFTDGGPAKTIGALFALASRRISAAAGLFLSGIFFLLAIGFALTAIAEVVAPDLAGFWVNADNGTFIFGVSSPDSASEMIDVLGLWLFPVSAGLAVVASICGHRLSQYFVQVTMRRKK